MVSRPASTESLDGRPSGSLSSIRITGVGSGAIAGVAGVEVGVAGVVGLTKNFLISSDIAM